MWCDNIQYIIKLKNFNIILWSHAIEIANWFQAKVLVITLYMIIINFLLNKINKKDQEYNSQGEKSRGKFLKKGRSIV